MAREIQEPVITTELGPGRMDETVSRHPAFCQIGASRVSGRTNLYASDFGHNAFMTISIRRSELHRNLFNDWHYGKEELIEVALSEAQWATFVSAPNVGSGVPCTLQHFSGKIIPGLPDPIARSDQFSDEMKKSAAESLEALDELAEMIDALGLPKGKASQLKEQNRVARAKLASTIPFIVKQFDEHLEETVEKAKAEIHGYMINTVQRAGIAALSGPDAIMPLELE